MKILFVTLSRSEEFSSDPAADFAGALPPALAARGHEVVVVVPAASLSLSREEARRHRLSLGWRGRSGSGAAYEWKHPGGYTLVGVDAARLGALEEDEEKNLPERVAAFARAALVCCKPLNFAPEVIHVNDWRLGPVCALLEERFRDLPELNGAGTVFTFHDLEGAALFAPDAMMAMELDWSLFTPDQMEFSGKVSFLKAGLAFADRLTVGSRAYAAEIRSAPAGRGLEDLLRDRGDDLRGIPHGLSAGAFDPRLAPDPARRFDAQHPGGKATSKTALQRRLGLPVSDAHPLVAAVMPLSGRAGFDLILQAATELLQLDIQLIIAGRGEEAVEAAVRDLAGRFPHRLAFWPDGAPAAAAEVLAGADLSLFPAREAPCAPLLLAALRLGAVPVARATGAQADWVDDFSHGEGCGFLFEAASAPDLLAALRRGLRHMADARTAAVLRQSGMTIDLSWELSARRYEAVYREAAALRR